MQTERTEQGVVVYHLDAEERRRAAEWAVSALERLLYLKREEYVQRFASSLEDGIVDGETFAFTVKSETVTNDMLLAADGEMP